LFYRFVRKNNIPSLYFSFILLDIVKGCEISVEPVLCGGSSSSGGGGGGGGGGSSSSSSSSGGGGWTKDDGWGWSEGVGVARYTRGRKFHVTS
jgi:hypothetical protein